jgi:hypothetical protein
MLYAIFLNFKFWEIVLSKLTDAAKAAKVVPEKNKKPPVNGGYILNPNPRLFTPGVQQAWE